MKRGTFALLLAMECLLIALGIWQLYRLQWKQNLLAEVATQQTHAPILYDGHQEAYRRVRIPGKAFGSPLRVYSGKREGSLEDGYRLLLPWQSTAGPVLLVDIGWVPTSQSLTTIPRLGAEVTGTLVPGDHPGWLAPKHTELPRDTWYWVDISTMARALETPLAPHYLIMDAGHACCQATPVVPHWHQRHLEYALTWFALALTLAVMVGVKLVRGRP
jgi:surfeit locus 1 family protein